MKYLSFLILILLVIYSSDGKSQINYRVIDKILDDNNKVIFIKIDKENFLSNDESMELAFLKSLNNNSDEITYKQGNKLLDNYGNSHKVYNQYYKGVIVNYTSYGIHSIGNDIVFANGTYADVGDKDIIPKISLEQAIELLKLFNKEISVFDSFKFINLCFFQDFQDKDYKLTYKILFKSENDTKIQYQYIDAKDGKLLHIENLIFDANTTNAIAQTAYSGTQNYTNGVPISSPNFVTDSYNGQFRLHEVRGSTNVNILTYNLLHGVATTSAVDFFDNDNNWSQTELGNDKYALDAHWGAEKVFDYWKNVQNRNSIDNQGMNIRSYVHWGNNIFNAEWTGSYMRYGDGISNSALVSLDVCAHEFGHGINQYIANIIYEKEAGALNEGFSDIWGAVIENWAAPNKNKWLIGEEFNGGPLRSMSNPNQHSQPDTYNGTNWYNVNNCTPDPNYNDNCGVHTNSGVLNYWFYLLSDGGSGINDFNNAFYVNGIGITKAANIAYQTEYNLIGLPNANYSNARTASIQAVQTLYGVGSCEEIAVIRAWYAVGVGANYTAPTLSISGANSICSANVNTTYTLNGAPANAIVTWSYTSQASNPVILTPNGTTCTVSRNINSNSLVVLSAIVNICGQNYTPVTKTINVGSPYILYNYQGCIYPEAQVELGQDEGPCNSQCYSPSISKWWCAGPVYNATSVTWQKVLSVPANYNFWQGSWSGNNNFVNILFKSPNQYVELKTTISNACNATNPIIQYYCFSSTNTLCSGNLKTADCQIYDVSLNPSTKQVQIKKKINDCGIQSADLLIKTIQIVDKVGNIVKEQNYQSDKSSTFELNLSEAKNDIYFVLIQYNDLIETHQIAVFR